jgi:hypothetical protein
MHLRVMLMWQVPPRRSYSGCQDRRSRTRCLQGPWWRTPRRPGDPFRIKRAMAGETIEETTFDRIRINARIDPKKFETPK